MRNKNKKVFIQKSNGGNETSIDNNGKEQRSKKAGRNLSTPCCVAVGLHASAAEDYLSKKEPNGWRCGRSTEVLYAWWVRGIIVLSCYWLSIRIVWLVEWLIVVFARRVKEPRHCAPAPSLMTCQFRRVRRPRRWEKSDIRVAIYYFDFMWGDRVEIDRVWLGPFNYSAFSWIALCIVSTVQ